MPLGDTKGNWKNKEKVIHGITFLFVRIFSFGEGQEAFCNDAVYKSAKDTAVKAGYDRIGGNGTSAGNAADIFIIEETGSHTKYDKNNHTPISLYQ